MITLFNVERLELRRLRTDLVELFKIVHGYTKCSIFNSLSFSCNNVCNTTRGHRFKLNTKRVNKNLFKYYFTNRIVRAWNSLPDHCFNTNLISTFKRNVCCVDLSDFVHGQL